MARMPGNSFDSVDTMNMMFLERLDSFVKFSDNTVSERGLASAGFKYDERQNVVYCDMCGIRLQDWNVDDPIEWHRMNSPNCPFILHGNGATRLGNNYRGDKMHHRNETSPINSLKRSGEYNSYSKYGGEEDLYGDTTTNRFDHRTYTHTNNDFRFSQNQPNPDTENMSMEIEQQMGTLSLNPNNERPFVQNLYSNTTQQTTFSQPHAHRTVSPENNTNQFMSPQSQNNYYSRNLPPGAEAQFHTNSQSSPFPSQPPSQGPSSNNSGNSSLLSRTVKRKPVLLEDETPPPPSVFNQSISVTSPVERPPVFNPENSQQNPGFERITVTSNNEAMQLVQTLGQQGGGDQNVLTIRNNQPPAVLDYTDEETRFRSFIGIWPITSPVQPADLAAAGLYYTGPNDRVQCAWCRGGLYGWEQGDTAFGEHSKHFPECPFVQQRQTAFGVHGCSPPTLPQETETLRTNLRYGTTNSQTRLTVNYNHQPVVNTPQPVNNYTQPNTTQTRQPDHSNIISIVQGMGYSLDMINTAIERVTSAGEPVTTDSVLEKVFQLEEEPVDQVLSAQENPTTENLSLTTQPLNSIQPHQSLNSVHTIVQQNQGLSQTGMSLQDLEAENSRLKQTKRCKVCMDNEVEMLFLPCRHIVCCESCSKRVTHCPFCREYISGVVKAYIP